MKWIHKIAVLMAWGHSLWGAPLSVPFFDLETIRQAFENEHRVFEKIIEGKNQWQSNFCEGAASYRIGLRTQIRDLDIELDEEGSVMLKAVLHEPAISLQGSYRGVYSFCYPLNQGINVEAESIALEARVEFKEAQDGTVALRVTVSSIQFGLINSDALSPEFEENLTGVLNKSLEQLWSSQLGDWFNVLLSDILNRNIPKPL